MITYVTKENIHHMISDLSKLLSVCLTIRRGPNVSSTYVHRGYYIGNDRLRTTTYIHTYITIVHVCIVYVTTIIRK